MGGPPVYADATALIGIARIGRLDLLTLLPVPIRITEIVWQEVAADHTRPGAAALHEALDAGLLVVVDEGDAGEASVVSAAAATQGSVLIDERKARAAIAVGSELRDAIQHV